MCCHAQTWLHGVQLYKQNMVFMLQVFLATSFCGLFHFVSGSADIIFDLGPTCAASAAA